MARSRNRTLSSLSADESGTASIEFTIVLSVLVVAFMAAGMVIGPAVHTYATRLKTISMEARTVLNDLQAAQPPAPAPQTP